MDCVPQGSLGTLRVCGSISRAAARHSLHSVALRGAFINIPISGVPDCSICRNKLGIVFDIRSENTATRGGTEIWIHVYILRFSQWAKSGPLLLRFVFKWLYTTVAPGVSVSHCLPKTDLWEAAGFTKVIDTFLVYSRAPLLSMCCRFFPAADWFSEWRCLTATVVCERHTLFSQEGDGEMGRWRKDRRCHPSRRRIHRSVTFPSTPESTVGFARLTALDSLVNR